MTSMHESIERLERAVSNVVRARPNLAVAEGRLFKVVSDGLEYPLALVDDEEPGRVQLPGHIRNDVEIIVERHLPADIASNIDCASVSGVWALLARLFDPEGPDDRTAALAAELSAVAAR